MIDGLYQIRAMHGGNAVVKICFDGPDKNSLVPYMAVNSMALDDDEPDNPIALVCVAEGNHPYGNLRPRRS